MFQYNNFQYARFSILAVYLQFGLFWSAGIPIMMHPCSIECQTWQAYVAGQWWSVRCILCLWMVSMGVFDWTCWSQCLPPCCPSSLLPVHLSYHSHFTSLYWIYAGRTCCGRSFGNWLWLPLMLLPGNLKAHTLSLTLIQYVQLKLYNDCDWIKYWIK